MSSFEKTVLEILLGFLILILVGKSTFLLKIAQDSNDNFRVFRAIILPVTCDRDHRFR